MYRLLENDKVVCVDYIKLSDVTKTIRIFAKKYRMRSLKTEDKKFLWNQVKDNIPILVYSFQSKRGEIMNCRWAKINQIPWQRYFPTLFLSS